MNRLFLALFSGLLFAFSWPSIGFFPFIFIAFIPLLILESQAENSKQVFIYSFIAFFIFNLLTTYWIYHASAIGSIIAFMINSTLMACVIVLFYNVKKKTSSHLGYFSLIVIWIAMEYFHLNWDLSWPWLTLGNVFSSFPLIVQWYEFSGFLSGSVWVLLMNILLFRLYSKKFSIKTFLFPLTLFIIPCILSVYLYNTKEENDENYLNVLILQPNVDPYIDKFSISYQTQFIDLVKLAKTKISHQTQLLLAPETALVEEIWENKIESSFSVKAFRELQKDFPNLNILVGATTYKIFEEGEKLSTTARSLNSHFHYDIYNSAIYIPSKGDIKVYHKKKLVPGVEKIPFPKFFDPIVKLVVNLGGVSGSLASDNYTNQFVVDGSIVSPLICYESVYGDMSLGKTNLLAVITNDGWWKNTAGYRQHFEYARLRAIEQRKSLIRSANTGISTLINMRGDILFETLWSEKVCLNVKVATNDTTTFYSKYGDYLGRIFSFVAVIILLRVFVKSILKF